LATALVFDVCPRRWCFTPGYGGRRLGCGVEVPRFTTPLEFGCVAVALDSTLGDGSGVWLVAAALGFGCVVATLGFGWAGAELEFGWICASTWLHLNPHYSCLRLVCGIVDLPPFSESDFHQSDTVVATCRCCMLVLMAACH
jgi:hypothetical protein